VCVQEPCVYLLWPPSVVIGNITIFKYIKIDVIFDVQVILHLGRFRHFVFLRLVILTFSLDVQSFDVQSITDNKLQIFTLVS
jgi:hypothetical protein